MSGQAKVGEDDVSALVNEDITRFDVAVDDVERVEVAECSDLLQ